MKKHTVRFTESDWELLKKIAKREGCSISQLLRSRAFSSSNSVSGSFESEKSLELFEEVITLMKNEFHALNNKVSSLEDSIAFLKDRIRNTGFQELREKHSQAYVESMISYFSREPGLLLSCNSIDDLISKLRFPHWKDYVLDFLEYLEQFDCVKLTARSKLIWNKSKTLEVLRKW